MVVGDKKGLIFYLDFYAFLKIIVSKIIVNYAGTHINIAFVVNICESGQG